MSTNDSTVHLQYQNNIDPNVFKNNVSNTPANFGNISTVGYADSHTVDTLSTSVNIMILSHKITILENSINEIVNGNNKILKKFPQVTKLYEELNAFRALYKKLKELENATTSGK